ncbi:MAG TPA: hypothetical protein VF218_10465 [Acidothermaceae bacterium]|jgi:hypothetical protein
MGESFAQKAMKQGPLPKSEDDSELVGEDEKNPPTATERETADYFTIPAPGAGSFPVPHTPEEQDGDQAPAEQEAER